MQISIHQESISNWSGSILIHGILEDNLDDQLSALSDICSPELLSKALQEQEFSGKNGQLSCFNWIENKLEKLILVGLGNRNKLSLNALREATALSCRKTEGHLGKIGIVLPWDGYEPKKVVKAVGEAARLTVYKDIRFLSDPNRKNFPGQIELIGIPELANSSINEVNAVCAGVEIARELVAAPPNSLTPSELAKKAKAIGNEFNLQTKILDRKDCLSRGMGAFLAVSQGSDLDPKFIHLTYKPKGEVKKRLAMVGKGLTFDSGGYNLKVGASQIEMMKYDMGGSASVIGAARAIGELQPKNVEIHFLVATCENMINGSAVHPGDIVKASNGKTIEINNTDAEGRLTLADALIYACNLKPDAIVDLATLTGACVIALGEEIAGLWSNSDDLANQLQTSSQDCGEALWRMPLQKSYKEGLKSMFADIKNTGPRAGGSITAALFLNEFIKDNIQWAHVDIAGTCWTDKGRGLNPAGATGFGVRTLVHWACSYTP